MNKYLLPIFGLLLLISTFIYSGGIFRQETIQVGIVHRINIVTGELSLCVLEEGCKSFDEKSNDKGKVVNNPHVNEKAIYTIQYIREHYPQYENMTDLEVADAMYRKFVESNKAKVPRSSFYEVVGYKE